MTENTNSTAPDTATTAVLDPAETTSTTPTTPTPEAPTAVAATAPVPATATPAPHTTARGFGIASVVLGAASLITGWALVAPVVGLVLGAIARRREPDAQGLATAGIVLNIVALAGWVLAGLGVVGLGVLALAARVLHYGY